MSEKMLRDHWQPNEVARFDRLYGVASFLLRELLALTHGSALARTLSSSVTEEAIRAALAAISNERREWLDLARERARADADAMDS